MLSVRPYLAAAGLLYLVGTPFALDGERHVIDERVRASVAGRYMQLSDGRTHYDLLGPGPSEAVVFVHGFSSPSYVWGRVPRRLQDAGYRTLVYDLYGRGFSDRPDVDYDLDLFDRQLSELLDAVQLRDKVHVVGLSMGGIISSEFALRHPERVASLTLIDPAGFDVDVPAPARLMSLPVVGDYLFGVFGERALVEGNARGVYDQSLVPELQERFSAQLAYRGFKRAILSSMRNMPLADFRERYAALGQQPLPIQIFWGRQDRVTPYEGAAVAASLLPAATIRTVEDAGHLSHYEKPDVVVQETVNFLRGHPAPRQGGIVLPGMCAAMHAQAQGAPADPHASHAHGPSRNAAGDDAGDDAAARKAERARRRAEAAAKEREEAAAHRPPSDAGEKPCRECDPRAQQRRPTDSDRARRRALSQPSP